MTSLKRPEIFNNVLDEHTRCPLEAGKALVIGAGFGFVGGNALGWWMGLSARQGLMQGVYKSANVGGLAAAYYMTMCTAANLRHKDDSFNAGIGGAVTGLLLGAASKSMGRMALHSAALGVLMTFFDTAQRNYVESRGLTFSEKIEKRGQDFFAWPKRDPFKARWEEIQAREAAAGAAAEE
ncbi:hypothetical protein HK102_004148 [Quaeritorhiza haematococci]|nr:hypothetical protein HK102_004148 [Quaeritorhiza haematococci]